MTRISKLKKVEHLQPSNFVAKDLKTTKKRQRQKKLICFKCRQFGHLISECKSVGYEEICCFKCGSLSHTLSNCTEKGDLLKFATCFKCKQKGTTKDIDFLGHLVGQCPENEMGIYPNGGSCKYCGSVRHLSYNCKPTEVEGAITLGTMDLEQGGDDDDQFLALRKLQEDKDLLKHTKFLKDIDEGKVSSVDLTKTKKKPKVVKF